jgi:transcriptional regulator with XRE-family HTH domain
VRADDPQIGKRIRQRRLEQGLSLRAISQPGISHAYVSRVEAGARRPSLSALIDLAAKLDTTGLYLLTGRDDARCPLCGRN